LLEQIHVLQARIGVLEAGRHAEGAHVNGANGTNGATPNGSLPVSGDDQLADDAASAVYELRNHI
jgi:hypothetical protein